MIEMFYVYFTLTFIIGITLFMMIASFVLIYEAVEKRLSPIIAVMITLIAFIIEISIVLTIYSYMYEKVIG